MKFVAKKIEVRDCRGSEDSCTSGWADVHYEVLLESRDWGIKSMSVIVMKIECEIDNDEKEKLEVFTVTENIETETEVCENGEALVVVSVELHDDETTVYFQRSL